MEYLSVGSKNEPATSGDLPGTSATWRGWHRPPPGQCSLNTLKIMINLGDQQDFNMSYNQFWSIVPRRGETTRLRHLRMSPQAVRWLNSSHQRRDHHLTNKFRLSTQGIQPIPRCTNDLHREGCLQYSAILESTKTIQKHPMADCSANSRNPSPAKAPNFS